jgi:hypothetical protein
MSILSDFYASRTQCKNGHPFSPENTRPGKTENGRQYRRCVACDRSRSGWTGGLPSRARTHCPSGHPYNKHNTCITSEGGRACRACRRVAALASYRRHRKLKGRWQPPPLIERFWKRVDKNGPIVRPDLGPCWLWIGAVRKDGYGRFSLSSRGSVIAHRWGWEYAFKRGPVPRGLDLDHLCRVHRCVRESHLEPVTRLVNLQRGYSLLHNLARHMEAMRQRTHCIWGHEFTPANTFRKKNGTRACKACFAERRRSKAAIKRRRDINQRAMQEAGTSGAVVQFVAARRF